jgi:hypothetical protein
MLDIDKTVQALIDWLSPTRPPSVGQDDLHRILTWAKDEFQREDYLPAAISQRFSFRAQPPKHVVQDLDSQVTLVPGDHWEPRHCVFVFTSTPDQFSARLALAHDYAIRHDVTHILLITDYFDNQAFARPAATFAALRDNKNLRFAMLLYTSVGFALIPVLQ